jgi:hypothetical protein
MFVNSTETPAGVPSNFTLNYSPGAHICNTSYSGGKDQKAHCSVWSHTWENSSWDHILKILNTKKAQVVEHLSSKSGSLSSNTISDLKKYSHFSLSCSLERSCDNEDFAQTILRNSHSDFLYILKIRRTNEGFPRVLTNMKVFVHFSSYMSTNIILRRKGFLHCSCLHFSPGSVLSCL